MKEKVVALIGDKLDSLGVMIDDVRYEEEDGQKFLRIVLDREEVIPINTVVMATRIINPLLDQADLIEEAYILDVYAKEKGEN